MNPHGPSPHLAKRLHGYDGRREAEWPLRLGSLVWLVLLGQPLLAWSQGEVLPADPGMRLRWLPLEVRINGQEAGSWVLLERDGLLHAPEDAVAAWRLKPIEGGSALAYAGQRYLPIYRAPGFSAALRESDQSMDLSMAPGAFNVTRLGTGKSEVLQPTDAVSGLLLNFDINAQSQHSSASLGNRQDLGASGQVRWSMPWGVFTHDWTLRRNEAGTQLTRQDTALTVDWLQRGWRMRLGDGNTQSNASGRSLRYGGIQLGTEAELRPGEVRSPRPRFSGEALTPSTVEIYLDGVLRQTQQVPTGPFVLDNTPQLSGGVARVVVRDSLGREVVTEQAFLTGARMLAQGLSDWTVDLGLLRTGAGTANNRYDQPLLSALWRYGFSDTLTLEGLVQSGAGVRNVDLSQQWALPQWQTMVQSALSLSQASTGTGWSLESSAQAPLPNGAQLMLNARFISPAYTGVGQGSAGTRRNQWVLSYSQRLSPSLSLGLNASRQTFRGQPATRSVSLSPTWRIRPDLFLSLNVSHRSTSASASSASLGRTSSTSSTSAYAQLSWTLDGGRQLSWVASQQSAGAVQTHARWSQSATAESPWSWQVLGGQREQQAYSEAGAYRRTEWGDVRLDASASQQSQTLRAGWRGAWVMAGGQSRLTSPVYDSYALVEAPGLPDVGITLQGGVRARTNGQGVAVVSGLHALRLNRIGLAVEDLPLEAEFDTYEHEVVPAVRGAMHLRFAAREGRSGQVRVVLEDGSPAPAGAEVRVLGATDDTVFPVASDGALYLMGVPEVATLQLSWGRQQCQVGLPAGALSQLGAKSLMCAGLRR